MQSLTANILRQAVTYDRSTGRLFWVEEVKGAVTDVWRIKQHLMMSVHGIEVKEIRA